MAVAVGALGFFQMLSVLNNMTQIEQWIVQKAESRCARASLPRRRRCSLRPPRSPRDEPFAWPYDLGSARANIAEWWNQSMRGDGLLSWRVAEGSDAFSLTREQLAQKARKEACKHVVHVVAAAGTWHGCEWGPYSWWRGPPTCETHLQVSPGDAVIVWSADRQWLYGELAQLRQGVTIADGDDEAANDKDNYVPVKPRRRGWFPEAACGVGKEE